jgi:hypothetical protein
MTLTANARTKESPPRARKSKFQADLAPSEDSMVRALKAELQMTSNSDFLSDAVTLFRWAVSERRRGHHILSESASGERKILVFPRLERVAPDLDLPQVDLRWTEREIESLAALATAQPAQPTEALIRASASGPQKMLLDLQTIRAALQPDRE